MTAFTKTISNSLNVYGVEPTNLWGTMKWGTDVWGYRDVDWLFNKGIADTMTVDSSMAGFNVTHLISDDLTIDNTLSREFGFSISDSFSVSSAVTIINVINNGWYVSKGGITNALLWPNDDFTAQSDPSTTWNNLLITTPTWVQI